MREKRFNGDGSITLRKDGRWMIRIMSGFRSDGKRNIITKYARSEQEAKKILRTLRVQVETKKIGLFQDTLNDYMDQFLELYKRQTIKAVSYDTYKAVYENHVRRSIGEKRMSEVTRNDVQRLINEISKKRSYATVSKVKVVLNMCFKHALEDDMIQKNPVAAVKLPRKQEVGVQKRKVDILTQEEIEVIKKAAFAKQSDDMTKRFAPVFLLMLNTGIRMGEMLALTWKDIDLEAKTLSVNRTRTMIQNRDWKEGQNKILVTTTEPKSLSSKRIIPLNHMAIQALEQIRRYRRKVIRESDFLLHNRKREMITQEILYRAFDHVLCQGMGEAFVHHGLHVLRHTFATKALRAGSEIADVSKILGHGSVSVTYNTYIHVDEEQKRSVVDLLEDLL